jgi:hypothetical protein
MKYQQNDAKTVQTTLMSLYSQLMATGVFSEQAKHLEVKPL